MPELEGGGAREAGSGGNGDLSIISKGYKAAGVATDMWGL